MRKTAIVTSFDENYYDYVRVLISSLSTNYSGSEPLDLYCLVPPNLLSLEASFISSCGPIENLKIKFRTSKAFIDPRIPDPKEGYKWFSKNAWHRLFVASELPDVDRAIYIDPDTLIIRDIQPLLDFPEINKFAAYVEYSGAGGSRTGRPDIPYFNDGVFITDLNYWRSNNIEAAMMDYLAVNGPTEYPDQDLLNIFFFNVLAPLPITFNFYAFEQETIVGSVAHEPVIVHFVGSHKPWISDNGNKWVRMWREAYSSLDRLST